MLVITFAICHCSLVCLFYVMSVHHTQTHELFSDVLRVSNILGSWSVSVKILVSNWKEVISYCSIYTKCDIKIWIFYEPSLIENTNITLSTRRNGYRS